MFINVLGTIQSCNDDASDIPGALWWMMHLSNHTPPPLLTCAAQFSATATGR